MERGHTRARKERAQEKPSLSGHVQAASSRVEELRPGAAAAQCLCSPLPPSWRTRGGRRGEVTSVSAPPRPQLPRRGRDSLAGSTPVPQRSPRPSRPHGKRLCFCSLPCLPELRRTLAYFALSTETPGAPWRGRLTPGCPSPSGSVSHASDCR